MEATDKSAKGTMQTLGQFRDAFKLSMSAVQPHWDQYLRLYKLWRGVKPAALDATISNIWINLCHSLVQDRLPEIFANVFSNPDYMTLESDHPRYDLSRDAAQTWLRHLLDDKIKIRSDAMGTMQSVLIGGTGFRMPYVRYAKNISDQWVPTISSRDIDFYNVLPSANGGLMNPDDGGRDDAVDWIFIIDWWTEAKIEAMADQKIEGWNVEQVGKMLRDPASYGAERYEEDAYKNEFKQVNGMSYSSYGEQSAKVPNLPASAKKRRIIHWLRRDKHIIVGEDAFVLYEGKPPMGEGVIPLVKYCVTPDMKQFYGIGQLEMAEDLIMAMVMNFNYRMDHLLGTMFPTAWIRDDIRRGKTKDDFIPRPYSVNFFPQSVSDIQSAIFYDRRPEVSQQTFIEEDRMKALLNMVAGSPNNMASMGDIVGNNRSSGGVTSVMSKMAGRPNMESAIIEETGFREECMLLLKLGDIHVTEPEFVPTPAESGSGRWTEVSPLDITDKFTVRMRGSRYLADQNTRFQKMLALYPYWNNNPAFDQYELNRQVAESAEVLPDVKRALVPPAMPAGAPSVRPSLGATGAPGGAASTMTMPPQQGGGMPAGVGAGKQVRAF